LCGVAGCGNIDPLGVTSNLAYDPITSKVYAVGEQERHDDTTSIDDAHDVLRMLLNGWVCKVPTGAKDEHVQQDGGYQSRDGYDGYKD